ncbi:MAG: hypothetical protein ABSH14_01510 [Verrucomicrobiia bacterium]
MDNDTTKCGPEDSKAPDEQKLGPTQHATPELNPDDLALLHQIYTYSVECLAIDGQLPPTAYVRVGASPLMPGLKTGEISAVVMQMPESIEDKDYAVKTLRQCAHSLDADMLLLVVESWRVPFSPEEAQRIRETGVFVRPSQDPRRIEVVSISVQKPGGHIWTACVAIRRDLNGRPSIPAGPPQLRYSREATGRYANLLDGNGDHPSRS